MALLVVLIVSDLQNGHAVGFSETDFGIAGKAVIAWTSFASVARHIGPAPHRPLRRASRGPRRLPSAPSLQHCGHLRDAGYSRRATVAHGARRRRRTRRDSDVPVGSPLQPAFGRILPFEPAVDIRGECDYAPLSPRGYDGEASQRNWTDRNWWRQGFLLGKAMVRNPPNCGRLRTAFACTLARARDHVLRIHLGSVPATQRLSRTRRKNHDEGDAGRSINVALDVRRSASNGRSCGATTSPATAGVRLSPATQA